MLKTLDFQLPIPPVVVDQAAPRYLIEEFQSVLHGVDPDVFLRAGKYFSETTEKMPAFPFEFIETILKLTGINLSRPIRHQGENVGIRTRRMHSSFSLERNVFDEVVLIELCKQFYEDMSDLTTDITSSEPRGFEWSTIIHVGYPIAPWTNWSADLRALQIEVGLYKIDHGKKQDTCIGTALFIPTDTSCPEEWISLLTSDISPSRSNEPDKRRILAPVLHGIDGGRYFFAPLTFEKTKEKLCLFNVASQDTRDCLILNAKEREEFLKQPQGLLTY